MHTNDKKIAVAPLTIAIEKEERHGFATAKQKFSLTETVVVFGDKEGSFKPGQKIWVRGDIIVHGFVKEVFELDGKKFFFLPVEHVQLVE